MERELLRAISSDVAALIDEGRRLWCEGRLGEAQARLEAALMQATLAGSVSGLLCTRHLLGNLAYDRGDLAAAREHHRFVLGESESLGVVVGIASSLHNLGLIAAREGDLLTARSQLLAAAERYDRLDMREAAARARENLAHITAERARERGAGDEQP